MTATVRGLTAGRTRQLVETHAFHPAGGRDRPEGSALRPDHVVVASADAPLVLSALEIAGVAHAVPDLALLGTERAAAPLAADPAATALLEEARRLGFHAARPGEGRLESVYLDHFAAPGKLVVATGAGVPAAGALGVLALRVSGLEAAAVLSGAPLEASVLHVETVWMRGDLAPWVGGGDAALALVRALGVARLTGAVIELGGPGAEGLPMEARFAFVAAALAAGARAVLAPSDEITRAFLDARRREPEWKKSSAQGEEDAGSVLDLDAVEPMIGAWPAPRAPRPVRQSLGMRVGRIVIGSWATLADLARAARLFEGRRADPAVDLVVAPGSRATVSRATEDGTLEALAAAGATVLDGGWTPVPRGRMDTAGLCFGRTGEDPGGGGVWWTADVGTCAAAALAGRLVDPRAGAPVAGADRFEPAAAVTSPPLEPLPGAAPAAATPPAPRPMAGAIRGPVLIAVGDDVGAGRVLPWGPRRAARSGEAEGFADGVFEGDAPGFAARARAAGGGVIVAGRGFGAGEPAVAAALALGALGVRAVLAESYDAAFHAALVHAGVAPLRIGSANRRAVGLGDEIEIPDLPGALVPGRPVAIRDLTRGTQHALAHDLDGRAIELLRAGGLLTAAAAAGARTGTERS